MSNWAFSHNFFLHIIIDFSETTKVRVIDYVVKSLIAGQEPVLWIVAASYANLPQLLWLAI